MRELTSSAPGDTERIAGALAGGLRPGEVVAVSGELGSGKTTFVRGAARALGVSGPVTSPTYAIGNRYEGRVPVSHLDLYRLEEVGEDDWADLEPYFDGAVTFVEWPEAAAGFLGRVSLVVRLRLLSGANRLILVEDAGKDLEIASS